MIKYTISLLLLSTCLLSAKSSVWKVSKGNKVLYLGGTCHFLRPSDYPLPSEFERAYSKADTLVFEMDPSVTQQYEFTLKLLRASSYTDEQNLRNILAKETYKRLAEKCKQNGLSIEIYNKTKPSMIMMMLMVKELEKLGATEKGVEIHYNIRGLKDNKKILALETADFQIDLIASLGEGIENTIIFHGLQDIENLKNNFDILIESWNKGNLTEIEKYFVEGLRDHPKLYSSLLVSRNKEWAKSIEKLMKTRETEFVLVGAAHLAGDEGLIQLLKKKGYTVKQL